MNSKHHEGSSVLLSPETTANKKLCMFACVPEFKVNFSWRLIMYPVDRNILFSSPVSQRLNKHLTHVKCLVFINPCLKPKPDNTLLHQFSWMSVSVAKAAAFFKFFILTTPADLISGRATRDNQEEEQPPVKWTGQELLCILHKLQVFVLVASTRNFYMQSCKLKNTNMWVKDVVSWWNMTNAFHENLKICITMDSYILSVYYTVNRRRKIYFIDSRRKFKEVNIWFQLLSLLRWV